MTTEQKHRDRRLSAAVDPETQTRVQDLALETFRTPSQVVYEFILRGLNEGDNSTETLSTTKTKYEAQILANKSAELIQNLRNSDEYYDFKTNFWQICLILGGKMGKNSFQSTESNAIADLTMLLEAVRIENAVLYEECVLIMRKTLNRSQKDYLIPDN